MPNNDATVARIRELVSKGKLSQALALFHEAVKDGSDDDLLDQSVQLSARDAANEQGSNMNLVSRGEYLQERARITNALLSVVKEIETTPSSGSGQPTVGQTIIQNAEKIYNIQQIDQADFS